MSPPPTTLKPLTLGRLAKSVGLARASLLHYEAMGLLAPLARSESGYRLYGAAEVERLQAIRRFRDAGLPLETIRALVGPKAPGSGEAAALIEKRLFTLCDEVERLRSQQQGLARLLAIEAFRSGRGPHTKAGWVALLRSAGFDYDDMRRWHADFEAESPKAHATFLRALGLSAAEVAAIRRAAQAEPSLTGYRERRSPAG